MKTLGFVWRAHIGFAAAVALAGCGARTMGAEDGASPTDDAGAGGSGGSGGFVDVGRPSDPTDPGNPSGTKDAGPKPPDDPERQTGTVEVTMGPITLGPGLESTVCVERRLATTHPMDVIKVVADLPPGGHHLIFYSSNSTVEHTSPTPCQPAVFGNEAPLIIAQKPHSELDFPKGVAYALPAQQMVRIELHFLNTTTAPLALTAKVLLTGAQPGTVTDHSNLIFTGNLNISIPAQSTATVGPSTANFQGHEPIIFGVTGHQHQRGTGFLIELGDPAGSMKTIYDNHDWAEAPLTIFDPPIPTTPGQALRYTCTYANPTNQPINFGLSATDEMCFLWAYYYPDMGYNFHPPAP